MKETPGMLTVALVTLQTIFDRISHHVSSLLLGRQYRLNNTPTDELADDLEEDCGA